MLCESETEEMSIGSERPFEQKALRKALLIRLGGEVSSERMAKHHMAEESLKVFQDLHLDHVNPPVMTPLSDFAIVAPVSLTANFMRHSWKQT